MIHFRSYNINTNVQTSEYEESATSPVVGLVIRPSENLSLYANRIEGLAQGPVAGAGTLNIGEVFPPFQTVQYEIGGKVQFGRFNASIAAFQTDRPQRSEEHTTDLKSLMRISYAVVCLKKK